MSTPLIPTLPTPIIPVIPPPYTIATGSIRDCVRLRGLPYTAGIDDILEFMGDATGDIKPHGVHMVLNQQVTTFCMGGSTSRLLDGVRSQGSLPILGSAFVSILCSVRPSFPSFSFLLPSDIHTCFAFCICMHKTGEEEACSFSGSLKQLLVFVKRWNYTRQKCLMLDGTAALSAPEFAPWDLCCLGGMGGKFLTSNLIRDFSDFKRKMIIKNVVWVHCNDIIIGIASQQKNKRQC